jgi:hypothetical protein
MTRLGIATTAFALAFWLGLTTTAVSQEVAAAPPAGPDALSQLEAEIAKDTASKPAAAAKAASRHFIEFRSRSAFGFGHTFVVFGRVGEKLTARNVAGLHPRGDNAIVHMIGHVVPMQSATGASDGDLDEKNLTARYRVMLSAAQYHAAVGHIRELQANSPAWHATIYNCNAFVGSIAQSVGLKAPPTLLFPEDYINSLRTMNGEQAYAAAPASAARAAAVRPSTSQTMAWGADPRDTANAMARHISSWR